jgi:hypothetical protein
MECFHLKSLHDSHAGITDGWITKTTTNEQMASDMEIHHFPSFLTITLSWYCHVLLTIGILLNLLDS